MTKAIIEMGEQTGADDLEDDYERYGLYFLEAIGYIMRVDGSKGSSRTVLTPSIACPYHPHRSPALTTPDRLPLPTPIACKLRRNPMSDKNNPDKNVINVDPVTLLFIVVIVLFIPLVLAGFMSQ